MHAMVFINRTSTHIRVDNTNQATDQLSPSLSQVFINHSMFLVITRMLLKLIISHTFNTHESK